MTQDAKTAAEIQLATTPVAGWKEAVKPGLEWRRETLVRFEAKKQVIEKCGKKFRIVLLGDSITEYFEKRGSAAFERCFAGVPTLDLGFGSDRTQHLLWILEKSGLWENLDPELVTLLIGTNNFGWKECGVEATAVAARRILSDIRQKAPRAKIVLFGVFHRSNEELGLYRDEIIELNRRLKKMADGKTICFEDVNDVILDADGNVLEGFLHDGLHPTSAGYFVWSERIKPYVDALRKNQRDPFFFGR